MLAVSASQYGIRTLFEELEELRRCEALDGKTFLVGVGAAKCATSWIWHHLRTLPGVTVSPIKELHFFSSKFDGLSLADMDSLAVKRLGAYLEHLEQPADHLRESPQFQAHVDRAQMIFDDNAYFAHFARLCRPETQVLCEITPGYSVIGLNGFDYMKSFFATQEVRLKLLYVMRDPVARFWSQLRHMEQVNPDSGATDRWQEALEAPRLIMRGDYEGTVSDLDMIFSNEDVLYLFYEDLFSAASLRQLCNFIGLDPGLADFETRHNKTELEKALTGDVREVIHAKLGRQYAFCRDRFGAAIPDDWLA